MCWISSGSIHRYAIGVQRVNCCLCWYAVYWLSRQVVAFLGGYAFGFVHGFILAMLAVVAACIITFTVSRFLLRSFLLRHFSERIRQVDGFLQENTFTMALLIRLLPLGSNWMVNIAAGVSGVRSVPFFTGSALGYVPQMLIFSLVGSGGSGRWPSPWPCL